MDNQHLRDRGEFVFISVTEFLLQNFRLKRENRSQVTSRKLELKGQHHFACQTTVNGIRAQASTSKQEKRRTSLHVVHEALENLRRIKGKL